MVVSTQRLIFQIVLNNNLYKNFTKMKKNYFIPTAKVVKLNVSANIMDDANAASTAADNNFYKDAPLF